MEVVHRRHVCPRPPDTEGCATVVAALGVSGADGREFMVQDADRFPQDRAAARARRRRASAVAAGARPWSRLDRTPHRREVKDADYYDARSWCSDGNGAQRGFQLSAENIRRCPW